MLCDRRNAAKDAHCKRDGTMTANLLQCCKQLFLTLQLEMCIMEHLDFLESLFRIQNIKSHPAVTTVW